MLHVEAHPHLWLVEGSNAEADQGVRRSHDSVNKETAAHRMSHSIVWYPHSYFFSLGLFTVRVQPLILVMVV